MGTFNRQLRGRGKRRRVIEGERKEEDGVGGIEVRKMYLLVKLNCNALLELLVQDVNDLRLVSTNLSTSPHHNPL